MNKLSIIIPIYNEDKTIEKLLQKVFKVKLPKGIQKEIIVVDDGSFDKTPTLIKKYLKKIKYFRHSENIGKGAAIKTGIHISTGNLFIIQDADLEYDPKDYLKLLKPILENNSQVVYGTRLTAYPFKLWGKDKTVMPLHLFANHFLTFLTNILYGGNLTDMETCYKLFKKEIIDKIKIISNGFDFEPEITAKILKMKISIVEVPILVKPRTYREGKKIKWTDGIMAIWTLVKYRFMD